MKDTEKNLRKAAAEFADAFDAAAADGFHPANWPANADQMRGMAIVETEQERAYRAVDNSRKTAPASKIEDDQKAASKIAKAKD